MIAYTSVTSVGSARAQPSRRAQRSYGSTRAGAARRPRLLQKNPGALDLLAAQRAQKARDHLVHQLEIGRQRRRRLVGVVQSLFGKPFGVQDRARAAVDEHEFRPEHEAL